MRATRSSALSAALVILLRLTEGTGVLLFNIEHSARACTVNYIAVLDRVKGAGAPNAMVGDRFVSCGNPRFYGGALSGPSAVSADHTLGYVPDVRLAIFRRTVENPVENRSILPRPDGK
jgi:hypothetical protein